MPLEPPSLDDRSYEDLLAEAIARIPRYCPEWTDYSLSDPGVTLAELFAWMMGGLIQQLNRVPARQYARFLELVGLKLREAEPAQCRVTFWLDDAQPVPVSIPAGVEVATGDDPPMTFVTGDDAVIQPADLLHVLVSRRDVTGRRSYREQNLQRVTDGLESFAVFPSETPRHGDAFYLCFEHDLSEHAIDVEMDVYVAGKAAIDPLVPPFAWEALVNDKPREWARAEVEHDTTQGFEAAGSVRLYLPRLARGTVNNQTGYWLRCKLEPSPGAPTYRTSPQARQVTVASRGIDVSAANVFTVRDETPGQSNGAPGQVFQLAHAPVLRRADGESMALRFEDGREEAWQEVPDFANSGPDDRHYTLDSATGELRFGPALPLRDGTVRRYGAIPPQGAAIVMQQYRYGGGRAGNVPAGAITVVQSELPLIAGVSNRRPAQGGLDAETPAEARLRAPDYLRSAGRAVTARDFEYLAREAAPGRVGRVHCLQQTGANEVVVLVVPAIDRPEGLIPPDALALPPDLREQITAYLDERRLLATQLTVAAPAYRWVTARVRLVPDAGADVEAARAAAEARLYAYLNPLTGGPDGAGWPLGRDLFASGVVAELLAVPGIESVQSAELLPVAFEGGRFAVGDPAQEVRAGARGVIVSYRHEVQVE